MQRCLVTSKFYGRYYLAKLNLINLAWNFYVYISVRTTEPQAHLLNNEVLKQAFLEVSLIYMYVRKWNSLHSDHKVGNRRSSLPNRLCYPAKFNHSPQITQSEMLIIAIRWNGIGKFAALRYWRATSLEIAVRKLLWSVVIQTFLFDMYFNW